MKKKDESIRNELAGKGSSSSRPAEELIRPYGIRFQNPELLSRSLIHSSYRNEQEIPVEDNQRLEYLGDSVLGLVINEYLYHRFPESPEGHLARLKSSLVSETTLAEIGRRIHLGRYLTLGKGEKASGGQERSSNLADALEAVIAAVYLDAGLERVRKFVLDLYREHLEALDRAETGTDYKSRLQEAMQKHFKQTPVYRLLSQSGPDHKKEFVVGVFLEKRELARGEGSSRKKAEQRAARLALKIDLKNGEIGNSDEAIFGESSLESPGRGRK